MGGGGVTQTKRRPKKGKPLGRPQPVLRNKSVVSLRIRDSLATRRSYQYGWNELDETTFHSLGVIARRAPDGSPRFNFPQRLWLDPNVSMDWAEAPNLKVDTLALNILARFERGLRARISTDRPLNDSAEQFAELFLCTMPPDGGCIPHGVIREWLRSQRD
jgi:hypothetical protein